MADPISTQLTAGDSTSATVTVNFSAQAAGTLLTLHVAADDYKTGNPSGWSEAQGVGSGEGAFHGSYFWYKIATGAETSVQYTIGSASKSSYVLVAHTNIESASPLDVSAKQNTNTGSETTYTTPSSGNSSSGRRYGIGHIVGHKTSAAYSSLGTWTNSYGEVGERLSAGTQPFYAIGVAGLAFDGGGATSTGATFDSASVSRSGIIAVFKVASGGAAATRGTPFGTRGTAFNGGRTFQGIIRRSLWLPRPHSRFA